MNLYLGLYHRLLNTRFPNLRPPPHNASELSLRPANFFYDALGLDTVLPGNPFDILGFKHIKGCTIKVKAPDSPLLFSNDELVHLKPSEVYGSNTFELSAKEILSILEGQEIYLAPSLSEKEYREYVEAKGYSDEIETMIVRKDIFWCFTDPHGKIAERKPGTKDALKLITCHKLEDFSSAREKLGLDGCFRLLCEMFLTVLATVGPSSVLLMPDMRSEIWGGAEDIYWKAFAYAFANSRFRPIETFMYPSEEYRHVIMRNEPNFSFYIEKGQGQNGGIYPHGSATDIILHAVLAKKNMGDDIDVCILRVEPCEDTNRMTPSESNFSALGTAGLSRLIQPAAVIEFKWPVTQPDISKIKTRSGSIINETEIIIEGSPKGLPPLPKSLKLLNCTGDALEELPPLPEGLKELICPSNRLVSLPPLPKGLKVLICARNMLKSLPPLPKSLRELDISRNFINEIPPLPQKLRKLKASTGGLKLDKLPESLRELDCNSSNLEKLPVLPPKLKVLVCENNELRVLSNLPDTLRTLDCSRNPIRSIKKLPPNLRELKCSDIFVKTFPDLPLTLELFDCRGTYSLEELPLLPLGLKILECSSNRIKSVAKLPSTLEIFKGSSNQLSHLPKLPRSLTYLDVDLNQLSQLPKLPKKIKQLSCVNNALTSLPKLPSKLESLECSMNKLSELPVLPDLLERISCHSNLLGYIPDLPSGLVMLDCSSNELVDLPDLPDTIAYLDVHKNKLTNLPRLPRMLRYLVCSNNELTSLPELPEGIITIDCQHNQLTNLPRLPDTLDKLNCKDNNITRIPYLPPRMNSIAYDPDVKF